jgi:hypothetical protein
MTMPLDSPERGNVLFMILGAIILLGLLTIALRQSAQPGGSGIDSEKIALAATQVKAYGTELENAVQLILRGGISESDLRFAHPDASADYGDITVQPARQVFDPKGGAATYRVPPDGVNDGSKWEFYGGRALPSVGSARADLIAVLPNVTQGFCEKINTLNGQTGQPADTGGSVAAGPSPGDCLNLGPPGRFDDGQQFYDPPNTTNEASFGVKPASEACVQCATDSARHVYHVLLAR